MEQVVRERPGGDADAGPLAGIGRRILVMGILNVTPDSFSDGGRFEAPDAAVEHGLALAREGADILDIGGESTRPGYRGISAEEEQRRVLPAIAALAGRLRVPISIDTYKASTARAALRAGARIVNDVWGLQREPDIAAVAAEHGAPVVIMHNRDAVDPSLAIMDEMRGYFDRSLAIARRAGIPDRDVVLDPGIGFGKTIDQQLEVMRRLAEIRAFGFPVLVGVSRKSLLGRIAERESLPADRLLPSIGAHVLCATLGADIVRVHDVREHLEAIRVVDAVMGAQVSDRILVRRIAVYAYHGLLAEERTLGQRFFVSLDCGLDLAEAARHDDLTKSVSYADLAALAGEIAGKRRFRTIEALAGAIAEAALAAHPRVERITVTVDKPDAPIPAILDGVSVSITRRRDG